MHKKCDELSAVYGARWPSLLAAAQADSPKVALLNKFAHFAPHEHFRCVAAHALAGHDETYTDKPEPTGNPEEISAVSPNAAHFITVRQAGSAPPSAQDSFMLPVSLLSPRWTDSDVRENIPRLPPPPADRNGTFAYFLLDMASLAPVLSLNVLPTNDVLDMCAAPGGKSLAISQLLTPMGSLTMNEASKERGRRLHHVIQGYLAGSPLVEQEKLFLTNRDATRWFAPGKYDRVLLDAPCSSERHLLQKRDRKKDASHLREAAKGMANTQISMLIQAVETVKCGGRVVYSTCSLSPFENDFVVAKVMRRFSRQSAFSLSVVSAPAAQRFTPPFPVFAEPTKFGWMYLPDRVEGMPIGPIYVAVIEKVEVGESEGEEEADIVSSD